jgi:hypothetical protein
VKVMPQPASLSRAYATVASRPRAATNFLIMG